MYADEENVNPRQECFVVESEEDDWLLVDVELTNDDVAFLKDYVVIPVIERSQDGEKPLPNGARKKIATKGKVEKYQKYFHGKMISRMLPRRMLQPYKIERPLKYTPPASDMRNAERLRQMNCWLEVLSIKVPRPLGTLGHIPASRVNVKR